MARTAVRYLIAAAVLAVGILLVAQCARAEPAYFGPTDNWYQVPRTEYLYICGHHDAGYLHSNLPLWSGMTVDFDCPADHGGPGSIDGKGRDAGFYLHDVQDMTLKNPRITNVARALQVVRSRRVQILGGELSGNVALSSGTACIEGWEWSEDVTIQGTAIHDCKNGIWFGIPGGPWRGGEHRRLTIRGTSISDIYVQRHP
jgi:hypothetical protein